MAWAATTTPRDVRRADGVVLSFLVEDNLVIYKADIVRINAAGYATSAVPTSGDMAAGIALETVDNTTTGHTQGGKKILVQTEAVCRVFHNTDAAAAADVGAAAVCDGAATGDAGAIETGTFADVGCICGTVVGLVYDPITQVQDTSRVWIKLQTLQQIMA